MTETSQQISTLIDQMTEPVKVTGDSGSVEMGTIKDKIAAIKFLQSQEAVKKRGLGIKIQKITPDGTL